MTEVAVRVGGWWYVANVDIAQKAGEILGEPPVTDSEHDRWIGKGGTD